MSRTAQIAGSLVVAAVIALLAMLLVGARLPAATEYLPELREQREEEAEQREEEAEQREEEAEERSDD